MAGHCRRAMPRAPAPWCPMIKLLPYADELEPETHARSLKSVLQFLSLPFEDNLLLDQSPMVTAGFLIVLEAVCDSLDDLAKRIAEVQKTADACTCRRAETGISDAPTAAASDATTAAAPDAAAESGEAP